MKSGTALLGAILCLCACGPSGTARIDGIDVSHHQAPLDWGRMRDEGLRFAYIKATEGADWDDPAYRGHEAGAREAGVAVGAYHFFTFCADPAEQAAHFLSRLHLRPGDLPPAVDVEAGGNCAAVPDAGALVRSLGEFNARIESALGRPPVIYTTQGFFLTRFSGTCGSSPLWIRNVVMRPFGAGEWAIWQHDVGKVGGAEGKVDRNVFAGNEADFLAFLWRPETGNMPARNGR